MAKCKNLRTGVGLEGNGMTDREKLIDLMIEAKRTDPETGSFTDYLADYLLEHGVIVLPCKVGDIVYVPYEDSQTIEEKRVKSMSHEIKEFENSMVFFCKHNYSFLDTDINRAVFLTREEAEKALKEHEQNERL